MIVKQAKDVARQWVIEEGTKISSFSGAYLTGSTLWLSDNATLPATSDMDIMVVLEDPPLLKLGKFIYRDVLLEVSYMPSDQLQSADTILGQPHIAGSFSTPNIILDPSGQLTELQAAVSRDFAKRQWVQKRSQYAADMVLERLQALNESAPFHEQVTAWLFGTSLITYMLLVAGLKNPTVRRRYMATQELLAEYGHLDLYETLLEMLGCSQMSRKQVEHHLAMLADVFDVTKTLIKTPYRFASDISDVGRPIAIDGSQELIERGYHREAIFYMVATYSRCQHILYQDAPVATQKRFSEGYKQLLADLGVTSFADLQQRCNQVKAFLPHIWEITEAIMAANPEIKDECNTTA